jgi:hypothetical protein
MASDHDRQEILRLWRRPVWSDYACAFKNRDEIGPRMLARIGGGGLTPDDLS